MIEALTCDLEGGVPAPHAAVLVARHAVVHPGVQLEARVQEEEAPVGQLTRNGGEECSFCAAFEMMRIDSSMNCFSICLPSSFSD